MRLIYAKKAYDRLDEASKRELTPTPCSCVEKIDVPDPTCDHCGGTGVVHEAKLSEEDAAAIKENLISQGVPLGDKKN